MNATAAPRVVLLKNRGMVRQLFARIIREEFGLTLVAECEACEQGSAALLLEKPDLVIVDLVMFDGRAFELLRGVGPRLAQTRWLFISSVEQGHLVREAVRLGVQGFVMESADLATLREAVRRVLGGEMYYCLVSARLLVENMVDERRVECAKLSARERDVLRGFANGENAKAIAVRLGVSGKTVQNLLGNLRDKLGLHEPAELVHYALKNGYIENPFRRLEEPLVDHRLAVVR